MNSIPSKYILLLLIQEEAIFKIKIRMSLYCGGVYVSLLGPMSCHVLEWVINTCLLIP